MSVVIQLDRIGKQYRVGQIGGRRLVDDVNHWLAKFRGKEDPLSKVGSLSAAAPLSSSNSSTRNGCAADSIWALKDISFELKQGEVLGIVGHNGSGKSTALKILSRVTAPTEGEARVKGRIASLLEVGTGFHPELTGRENIYLNGAILGMTQSEIRGKFDEIVAFSGVEQFIDTPVKRYSSGMHVRLAFAVAAHLEPEILIVDEVLAVGDAEFQKKCLGKMKDVAGEGRTILFVSHNMEAVRQLCHRGIWLKNGRLHHDGTAEEIITAYFNSIADKPSLASSDQACRFSIKKLVLKSEDGQETRQIHPGDDLIVEIFYEAQNRVEKPYLTLGVVGIYGACFTANMLLDGARPEVLDGAGMISCRFNSVPLLPQSYTVKIGVRAKNGVDTIINYQEAASFQVVGDLTEYGCRGEFLGQTSRFTPVIVPYEWRLADGTRSAVSLNKPLK
jgi:lipopolysaccharide transport system ATP-binding protein